jgi:crotonobetainyl-CoA:carnitine CoA-transferase CaiB-like acyl-CoA transferase
MRYNTLPEVLTDTHLVATGFFEKATHPDAGEYRTMRHPVVFSETPAELRLPPPRLGADNETILESLGLGA